VRLISFERQDGAPAVGVMLDNERFSDLRSVDPSLPNNIVAILEQPGALARVRAVAAKGRADGTLTAVKLLPVIPRPHAIWALALNYKRHIQETGLTTSPDFPQIFLRTPASQVGHLQPLLCPPPDVDRAFDYEGELAVVIGRGGRHIPVERALEHVAGYACYNEGSVRAFQQHNRQFGLGKNFEASGGFGPWLMTADEFGDPSRQNMRTIINGYTRQETAFSDMLFNVPRIIAYLSTGYRLRVGDVIVTGTPGALPPRPGDTVGAIENQFGAIKIPGLVHMKPGDVVEVEISGLGTLKNPVVADLPREYRPD
jgi:2-keto-4-pentenoate hydratase/2-oxohepta-3-ene-1,7-dioic acid hydratase in catechol pathway